MMRVIVLAAMVCAAEPAFAEPPPGTDLNSPEHLFWGCHKIPGGGIASCCGTSNGHYLDADHWRVTDDGHYEVFIGIGPWKSVPDTAILHDQTTCGDDPDPTKRGLAMAWYTRTWARDEGAGTVEIPPDKIVCFRPGPEE